jgi:hypothetical protein
MNEILLSALAVVALVMLGVWIGHKLTLKSFAHVQPSVKELSLLKANTVKEDDPWDEAMKENPEDQPENETLNRIFNKTGLPKWLNKKKFFSGYYGPDTEDIINTEEMREKEPENAT